MNYFAHGYGSDEWADHMYGGSAWGWLFMLMMIGFLILGVVLVARLVSGSGNNSNDAPLDTLKRRYSKGEITKKQFEEMKKDIR